MARGPTLWAASVRVFDAAVQKPIAPTVGKRKFPGSRSLRARRASSVSTFRQLAARRHGRRGFQGGLLSSASRARLTTPIGGGIRSLNVALRQMLDLYVRLRPVQWFTGVLPSPVKHSRRKDQHGDLQREHRRHLRRYRLRGGQGSSRPLKFIKANFPKEFKKIRFGVTPNLVGIAHQDHVSFTGANFPRNLRKFALALRPRPARGISSRSSSARIRHRTEDLTIVHKGNIMKFTGSKTGAFRRLGYERGRVRARIRASHRRKNPRRLSTRANIMKFTEGRFSRLELRTGQE